MKSAVRSLLRCVAGNGLFRGLVRPLSLSGIIPYSLYRRLPVEGEFQTPVNDNAGFIYCSSYEDAVGRGLFWQGAGGFEPETIAYLKPLLERTKVFADVGANTGHFALYACAVNPALHVHAFEPVPATFECLKRNIERNGWAGRCAVHQKAVGAENGRVQFHVPHDALPTSASLNPQGFHGLSGDLIDVEIVRLDRLFEGAAPPDVLKIDVEGFEHLVLQGMEKIFASGHRPQIIFECHPDGPAKEIMDVLGPLGYKYLHLSKQGPVAFDAISPAHVTKDWNWAAVPA
ncbi:MAG: FkbM family methyltransferase [Alphaproteobacteria bacterium]|nr:FkbM family methyltransferase [Alphaproteobacteria bacterium]MCD8570402.1 FkbM family methyltransferase [Alphaproteobacteria bacterium]